MTLEELKSFSDKIEEDVFEVLSYEAAVKRRVFSRAAPDPNQLKRRSVS